MKQGSYERNFHIMNDDRFIMEKISFPINIEDNATEQEIHEEINKARQMVIDNFKAAYPHVEEHLNFHVARQVGGDRIVNDGKFTTTYKSDGGFTSIMNEGRKLGTFKVPQEPPNHSFQELEAMQVKEETTNGTIDTVEAIKKEIEAYKLSPSIFKAVYEPQVKGNSVLEELFREKLKKLEIANEKNKKIVNREKTNL